MAILLTNTFSSEYLRTLLASAIYTDSVWAKTVFIVGCTVNS